MKTLKLAAAFSLLAVGCTVAQSKPSKAAGDGQLEVLHGIQFDQSGIAVKVASNGCTSADSFRAVNNGVESIAIYRTKADKCRRRTHIIEVTLPLDLAIGSKAKWVENAFAISAD